MGRAADGDRAIAPGWWKWHLIFVDTNVFMYAVGREHPLRKPAQQFFERALARSRVSLYTSAEVLQELLHAYIPVQRMATLELPCDWWPG